MDLHSSWFDDRRSADRVAPVRSGWRPRLVRVFGISLTIAVLAGAGWIATRPKAREQVAAWCSMGHPQLVHDADGKVREVTNRLQHPQP